MTIEFSEFKVCGMLINFDNIKGKLIRLFKLASRPNRFINLDDIMCAVQDGNKNWEWFRERMMDLTDEENLANFKIEKNEFVEMMRQMVGDIKKYSVSNKTLEDI